MSFTHRNEGFVCEQCGANVGPAKATCRNHCPACLTSKHVDLDPGDRANPCGGLMEAVSYQLDRKKGIILHFRCHRCGAEFVNKAAADDDYERILLIR